MDVDTFPPASVASHSSVDALVQRKMNDQNKSGKTGPVQPYSGQHNSKQINLEQFDSAQINPGQIRFAAMSLLARREHSRFELQQKLSNRFSDCSELIQQVSQQLADEALQCDRRFADAFVAMRIRKGQGPIRIEKELAQRSVSAEIIAQALQAYDSQWPELAYSVWKKKYGMTKARLQDRAKQSRFMLYRGFSMEHIKGLWG